MVGLMGLTFFCNKCVEIFYMFSQDGNSTAEFKEICKKVKYSFQSFMVPINSIPDSEKLSLFNTNEEVESFEQVLESKKDKGFIEEIVLDIDVLLDESQDVEKRKKISEKLQNFFDALGDHSFYATKDCLRETEDLINI